MTEYYHGKRYDVTREVWEALLDVVKHMPRKVHVKTKNVIQVNFKGLQEEAGRNGE